MKYSSALLLLLLTLSAAGESPQKFWDRPVLGDLSYLNPRPAGARGFVSARNGHFYDGEGQRLRFWGINITGDAALPAPEEAAPLAAWIASRGFNLVRLHFLDRNWSPGGLVPYPDDLGRTGENILDPKALDRLDRFQAQLKKAGVYVNLNLHVGRTYPGTPPEWAAEFSKGLDTFHPPYVAALKVYSRVLLEHTNPYTGLRWKEDPGVALVEVNNENSLLSYRHSLPDALPPVFRESLALQWKAWLEARHPREDSFLLAYRPVINPALPGSLREWKDWTWETHQGAEAQRKISGTKMELQVLNPGKERWHVQTHQGLGSLPPDTGLVFQVEIRGTPGMEVEASVMRGIAPWDWYAPGEVWKLTGEWKTWRFQVPPGKGLSPARFNLAWGTKAGMVELRNPRLEYFQADPPGFREKNLPDFRSPWAYRQAFQEFLTDTDRQYGEEMRRWLVQEVGVRVPVAHTQANYRGPEGLRREAALSDWIDMHAYHDHPQFPGKPWDPENWTVSNTPLPTDGGALSWAAHWRVAGKPFILSEWNIPAPNLYRAAAVPALAVMAGLQDWDGALLYTLSDFDASYDSEKIKGYFDIYTDPAKTTLMPWGALAFREGRIPKLPLKQLSLPPLSGSEAPWDWRPGTAEGSGLSDALRYRLEVSPTPQLPEFPLSSSTPIPLSGPYSARGLWWIWGPLPENIPSPLGPLERTGWTDPSLPWGGIFMVTLDGEDFSRSRSVLITSLSGASNTGQTWNRDQTSLGKNWGRGPVETSGPRVALRPEDPSWITEGQETKVINLPPGGTWLRRK